jgi:hypothetical protein
VTVGEGAILSESRCVKQERRSKRGRLDDDDLDLSFIRAAVFGNEWGAPRGRTVSGVTRIGAYGVHVVFLILLCYSFISPSTTMESSPCYTIVNDDSLLDGGMTGAHGTPTSMELRNALQKGSDEVKVDTMRRIIVDTLNGHNHVSWPTNDERSEERGGEEREATRARMQENVWWNASKASHSLRCIIAVRELGLYTRIATARKKLIARLWMHIHGRNREIRNGGPRMQSEEARLQNRAVLMYAVKYSQSGEMSHWLLAVEKGSWSGASQVFFVLCEDEKELVEGMYGG